MQQTAETVDEPDPVTIAVPGGEITLDAAFVDAEEAAIRRQAREYREGDRDAFDLPVSYPAGFTGLVMGAIAAIPYGETRTYGEIATALDNAPQPVGAACGRNPVPLVVPCHRVVAADGGPGLKRRLLDHERDDTLRTTLRDHANDGATGPAAGGEDA
ncbi:cysteine methyltransferase [Halobacteriales archaeon QS_6_71_20]|nr:MAG: cysteine methyltransferase [Halobacteriales archaeon QS_6_71_20]